MSPIHPSDDQDPSTQPSTGSSMRDDRETSVGRTGNDPARSDLTRPDLASRIMNWVENDDESIVDETIDPSAAGDYWVNDSTQRDLSAKLEDTSTHISTVDPMVVYLDGQLDDQQRKQLEDKLLVDDQARQHLAELQKSWDALDALPRAQCSQSFTESTVKLVVKDAIQLKAKTNRWRQPMRLAVGATVVLASLLIGYVSMHHWLTAEDRQLLQDMELIENWEKYEAVGDLPFLKRLEQEDLFTGELNNVIQ